MDNIQLEPMAYDGIGEFSVANVPDTIPFVPKPEWFEGRDTSAYIPNFSDPDLAAAFPTDEEREVIRVHMDACAWARREIKVIHPHSKQIVQYEPRWYQELLLQDPTRYQVWRLGRQTGKTTSIMIKALHHAFTSPNSKILILTPYDDQVKKIFWDRPGIQFMVDESSTLSASVVGRLTKSPPYRIKFNNGSMITGMTAGTKSGAGGGASRGKDSDFIIMDEADYLDDNDLRTIMGVRIGNPNVRIIASSTPSGKRGMWYKWNMGQTLLKWGVHHFPSSVVPYWDDIMGYDIDGVPITFGQEMVGGFDEYGIITEVLAEFPEELMGVFQKYYLDIMFGDPTVIDEIKRPNLSNYTYPKPPNLKTRNRVMGVDVDKYGAGPEIAILEQDPVTGFVFVLHRETIPRGRKGQLTLHTLVDKIIELDKKFVTSFIYCDRGYGEYVVESLHKYGKDHPETGLAKRVVPVFYGEAIEIPDPARRGLLSKVPMKPYIVNLMVRFTERMAIYAPKTDQKLKQQMEEYTVVARSTITNQPRYTSKNEHALDACMFALYGLVDNFSEELIFPRGAKGAVVRPRQNPGPNQVYIDPWTDRTIPKQDVRMRPDVLQLGDIPRGLRKTGHSGKTGSRSIRGLANIPNRTILTGHRRTY